MDEAVKALGEALAGMANTVSRQVLSRNDRAASLLNELQGTCVGIRCSTPPVDWHLSIDNAALTFAQGEPAQPDATIAGEPHQLLRWLFSDDNSTVTIDGDEQCAMRLRAILHELAAQSTEDLAHTVSSAAELGLAALRDGMEQISKAINTPPKSRS
jgi:ubiquinone biosynthesis protein UbiJ